MVGIAITSPLVSVRTPEHNTSASLVLQHAKSGKVVPWPDMKSANQAVTLPL